MNILKRKFTVAVMLVALVTGCITTMMYAQSCIYDIRSIVTDEDQCCRFGQCNAFVYIINPGFYACTSGANYMVCATADQEIGARYYCTSGYCTGTDCQQQTGSGTPIIYNAMNLN